MKENSVQSTNNPKALRVVLIHRNIPVIFRQVTGYSREVGRRLPHLTGKNFIPSTSHPGIQPPCSAMRPSLTKHQPESQHHPFPNTHVQTHSKDRSHSTVPRLSRACHPLPNASRPNWFQGPPGATCPAWSVGPSLFCPRVARQARVPGHLHRRSGRQNTRPSICE